MASSTEKTRERLQKIADSAEHLTKEEMEELGFDGDENPEKMKRIWATLAQMALDGELDPDEEEA